MKVSHYFSVRFLTGIFGLAGLFCVDLLCVALFCVALLCVGLLCVGFVPAASAQSEVSLESYLEEEEPSQTSLETAQENQEAPQESRNIQAMDEMEAAPAPQNGDDALPEVTTQLRIQTKGFDHVATKRIYAEVGGDPSRQTQEELAESIRQDAFDAAITGLFPLNPEHIEGLLKQYDKTKQAAETPVYGMPKPEVSVKTISLDPGVVPMVLKTAIGHITTLNILDVTGAPWPVQDISWAGDFEVIEPEEGGHIIRVTPMAHTAYGNMSIRLLTLKTPITITLRTERDTVQYRVDARIPEFGPFAQTPLIDGGSERVAGNALITSVLDGTPPGGARKLVVDGVDGRTTAYKIRGMTYVRTPLTLLSPGWEQSVSSADGMHVYALNDTPVLLLSDKGRFMRAGLTVGEDLFNE